MIPMLVEVMIQKIVSEVKVSFKGDGKVNICLYECWNLLGDIVKNKDIMSFLSNLIEEKLTVIFELMKQDSELNHDYNIIEIATSIISYNQSVADYFLTN